MRRKVLLICLDGCDPEYIERSPTPNLDRIAREGSHTLGASVIPAVTNVNNTSIVTGRMPKDHGITTNFWYDPKARTGTYMEERAFLLCPTILERAVARGLSAALLTAKKKLLHLLTDRRAVPYHPGMGRGDASGVIALAAEEPPEALTGLLGPTGGIYSPQINLWLLRAARHVLSTADPDVMYVSTTDFVQHKYAPDHDVAIEHTAGMDALIGEIIADDPEREVYVTADHGMRQMRRGVDLAVVLRAEGVPAVFQPIIKDRHVVHHNNLAGVANLYFESERDRERALGILRQVPGVEEVLAREEAAARLGLHPERIGDLFVLGEPGVVFGEFGVPEAPVDVRSHGSRHESVVPIYGYNAGIAWDGVRRNLDVARLLIAQLGLEQGALEPERTLHGKGGAGA